MAKTVVGLFDDARDAQDVLSDLQGLGFSASDAELITQGALSGDASNVVDRLTNEGVPSSDANLYLEGIRSGGALVVATTSDDQVDQVVDVMNRHNIVDLESRRGTFGTTDVDTNYSTTGTTNVETTYAGTTTHDTTDVSSGTGMGPGTSGAVPVGDRDTTRTTDYDTTTARTADYGTSTTRGSEINTGEEVAVPIVEEELRVGKRDVERGGVRVETRVEERPVEEQVTVRDETVNVQRRPASGSTTAADVNAFQEGTFEVRETDEEVVADKQARVVEEVVISKEAQERTETINDTVRRTDVDVQQVGGTRTTDTTTSGYGTTGTTGTTDTNRDRTLTERVEGATGLDVDRDGDVDGRTRR